MSYRFAFDIGVTSIGYAVFKIENTVESLVDLGTHIFPDGRDAESSIPLAKKRTQLRSSRKQRKRFLMRRNTLIKVLRESGFLYGEDEKALQLELTNRNPYELRVKALDKYLSLYELGRIFLSMNQHRGYRKTMKYTEEKKVDDVDTGDNTTKVNKEREKEKHVILEGIKKTERLLDKKGSNDKKFRTLGELLYCISMYKERLENVEENTYYAIRNYEIKEEKLEKKRKKTEKNKKKIEEVILDRNKKRKKKSEKNRISLYYSRQMYLDEFACIKKVQLEKYREYLENEGYQIDKIDIAVKEREYLFSKIEKIIFFHRKLKLQIPGKCKFEKDEYRCPISSPYFQKFRILQDINHIKVIYKKDADYRHLYKEIRDILVKELEYASKTYNQSDIKKRIKEIHKDFYSKLKLPKNIDKFNYSDADDKQSTKKFYYNETSYVFRSILGKEIWDSWDIKTQDSFVTLLLDRDKTVEDTIKDTIKNYSVFGLDKKMVKECLNSLDDLPQGYGELSKKALSEHIIPSLENKVISYAKSVSEYYGDHTNVIEKGFNTLPYYGKVLPYYCISNKSDIFIKELKNKLDKHKKSKFLRSQLEEAEYGKISNPTVHVCLRQLQKITNKLISKYEKPKEVVFELARELGKGVIAMSKSKKSFRKEQKENTTRNDKIKECIKKCMDDKKYCNDWYMKKYKLWLELPFFDEDKSKDSSTVKDLDTSDRVCVYSNTRITEKDVFTSNTAIDHIIPTRNHYDATYNNLLLCTGTVNAKKEKRTPYEVWGKEKEKWNRIKYHIEKPTLKAKAWRFEKDAENIAKKSSKGLSSDLPLTQYISKVACLYFVCLGEKMNDTEKIRLTDPFSEYDKNIRVRAITGKATAIVRSLWKLNYLLYPRKYDGSNKVINVGYKKNRRDHRHHAIDSFVIGMTNTSMFQQLGKREEDLYNCSTDDDYDRIKNKWKEYIQKLEKQLHDKVDLKSSLEQKINCLIATHKRDVSKKNNRLHEDKCYSPYEKDNSYVFESKDKDGDKITLYRTHCNIEDIWKYVFTAEEKYYLATCVETDEKVDSLVNRIRNDVLRNAVLEELKIENRDMSTFWHRLKDITNVRRVTVLVPESILEFSMNYKNTCKFQGFTEQYRKDSLVPYVKYALRNNWACDIYDIFDDKGDFVERKMEIITYFDANRKDFKPQSTGSKRKLLFRLHKNDVIYLKENKKKKKSYKEGYYKVVKFSKGNNLQIVVSSCNEVMSGVSKNQINLSRTCIDTICYPNQITIKKESR